jgi:transmembrane sensor
MRHANDDAITEEALVWRAKLARDDADWHGYTIWLEADPRHRAAYNRLDLIDAALAEHRENVTRLLQSPRPSAPIIGRLRRSAGFVGGGIAAAIALFVTIPMIRDTASVRSYEAGAGSKRVVVLADDLSVTLGPASRILVAGKGAERIELTAGEAFFDVRHDPARTLTVSAGDFSISDIGTRFSVNLAGKALRVGVSQGTVSISSPRTQTVDVVAGKQLLSAGDRFTLSPVAVTDVGSWRSGRLSYSDAPLSMVAADISRYSGRPVVIDASLELAHFSGSLAIGDGSRLLTDLATVVGARVRREKDGDHLSVGDR